MKRTFLLRTGERQLFDIDVEWSLRIGRRAKDTTTVDCYAASGDTIYCTTGYLTGSFGFYLGDEGAMLYFDDNETNDINEIK